ncbi:MAG: hypothetical protein BZY88_16540 [SAR202 cluster bacterium Io17-Chloro-G9]|nr:MAG: hypothetical protein BZY88_16540 [SAR202 cluster bacterium Io17-Chloro-G9]
MDKVIEITNRAVADYGFRQAVMYGAQDVGRRWGLAKAEQDVLENTALDLLMALPVPVPPADIPAEQARLEAQIRAAG